MMSDGDVNDVDDDNEFIDRYWAAYREGMELLRAAFPPEGGTL